MLQGEDSTEKSNDKSSSSLKFDASRHCIVNLVSTLTNAYLINMVNRNNISGEQRITRDQVVKAVPLPGVQFLSGNIF